MEEEKGPKNEEGMRRRKEKLCSRKGGIHVLIIVYKRSNWKVVGEWVGRSDKVKDDKCIE